MNDYSELKNYCYRLYVSFIKQYTKATTLKPTPEEIDNVKAFCVLSHAALEEYFEKLATKTMISAKRKFDGKSLIDKIPINQSELDAINSNIIQLVKTLTLSSGYYIYSKKNSEALKNYKSKLEKAAQLHIDNTILTLNDVVELTKKTDSYTNEILKETKTFFE